MYKEKLKIICKALCDSENQPHQWIDNSTTLEKELIEILTEEA